jgi:hypothetical protein
MSYKKRQNCYVPMCFAQIDGEDSMGLCAYHFHKMQRGEKVE